MTQRMIALVVDDNDIIREFVGRALSDAGFGVLRARDGMEAAEVYGACGADLLVTDLDMPRLDGVGLSQLLRAVTPDLPILIMTGDGGAAELGIADEVLLKPFGFGALGRAVERTLQGSAH